MGKADDSSLQSAAIKTYARFWVLHQLAPFADHVLGVAGAMDHRMIDESCQLGPMACARTYFDYDWFIRLPVMLVCLFHPTRRLLLVAHVLNVAGWADRMPAVWDYMCWCSIMEASYVVCAALTSSLAETARLFLPTMRAQLIVLYVSAAFWKLTTSWFDGHYSCSTVLMSELIAGLEGVFPPVKYTAPVLMAIAPELVAGMEFAVPALLLLQPRYGVLLALVFHQTINLMPSTYAGGFGIAMCARLIIFLPAAAAGAGATIARGFTFAPRAIGATALVAVTTAVMALLHGELDCHGGIFLLLAWFYFLSIAAPWAPEEAQGGAYGPLALAEQPHAISKMVAFVLILVLRPYTYLGLGSPSGGGLATLYDYASFGLGMALLCSWAPVAPRTWVHAHARDITGAAALVAFVYGFLHPVLGVQMMASSTMYGNVKNFGGLGNHMIVPTGVLQDALGGAAPPTYAPSWLVDGFGGGLVRVDATTSSVFRSLAVKGAEMTDKLPPRSLELLESINASGRYFEFYAARNYFDRSYDHDKTALHALGEAGYKAKLPYDDKYVVPAYELRRGLNLARGRGEAFKLTYTNLPAELTTPTQWKAYEGPKVVVSEAGKGAKPSCVVQTGMLSSSACAASEVAMMPPPSWGLRKLLHPYPTPLLEGAGDGQHCTT